MNNACSNAIGCQPVLDGSLEQITRKMNTDSVNLIATLTDIILLISSHNSVNLDNPKEPCKEKVEDSLNTRLRDLDKNAEKQYGLAQEILGILQSQLGTSGLKLI